MKAKSYKLRNWETTLKLRHCEKVTEFEFEFLKVMSKQREKLLMPSQNIQTLLKIDEKYVSKSIIDQTSWSLKLNIPNCLDLGSKIKKHPTTLKELPIGTLKAQNS